MSSKNPIVKGTPIERHEGTWVKREDLCCPDGPHLSKMRGIWPHIKNRDEKIIGVLDTYRSWGGWATAFCCNLLGKQCVAFYPRYTKPRDWGRSQQNANRLGAEIKPLEAKRSVVMRARARENLYSGGYMMPNAMKLSETVIETAKEVHRTNTKKFDTIVIPIGTGTIASGVIKGLAEKGEKPLIILSLGYTRTPNSLLNYIQQFTEVEDAYIEIIDQGYKYNTPESKLPDLEMRFPAHRHYEQKAWQWIMTKKNRIGKGKILFWNIG